MTVMPFGLCNSQATFQRLMDKTLQGLEHVQSFVDDCLIYSITITFEGRVRDLEADLERLRQANIQLRADKCHFAYKEVNFLGHRISEQGRRPLETSKEKLRRFPRPHSVREIQRFLESINYYRHRRRIGGTGAIAPPCLGHGRAAITKIPPAPP